ncbi:MAG: Non-specific protein-tyrosine kinase [Candidatus Eremiobacteraeota bacterium]|jgi:capsular exopolysaccharide synthesis family protein|nr:Non-specific protein-tyrosine kinase [Candidatus Eremiobacteraeota bacterium]
MLSISTDAPRVPYLPPDVVQHSPLDVLRRRALLFACTVAFFVVLVIAAVWMSPKSYTTHVKFIAGSGGATLSAGAGGQTILPVLNAILDASNAQSSETYAEMLRQTPAVERVIAKENLSLTPRQLLGHVKVKPVTNTSILDVGVTWSDPQSSARIANSLADAFVEVRRNLVGAQAESAIEYVGRQIPAARTQMHRSAATLATYESQHGIADADQQTQAMVGAAADTERKIAAVEIDGRQAAAQLGVVKQQLEKTSATITGGRQVAPNPAVSQLGVQLAQLDVQLKAALAQYTEQHPTVRALRAQDAQLRRQLAALPASVVAQDTTVANPVRQTLLQSAATLGSQIASDAAQLQVLKSQQERAKPAMRALPARLAALVQLKRQAKSDFDVYNALEQKLAEARIARTTTLSDVSVIARASATDAQVSPNKVLDIGVGFMISLFLGIVVVFAAERLDRSLKTEQDVVARLGLPVLSAIPKRPDGANVPAWLQAATVDAFLQLVTSLRYASSRRLTTIAFTSAEAEDGKSRVALNTAIALAELTPRVLLVDADLRLPSLDTKLGLRGGPGLSDVLVGTVPFDDAVRPTAHAGLDVLVAGTRVPNAFALLQSDAFDTFLAEAKSRYEAVLIDTPACGSVVDAAIVSARTDGTVYVVASRRTDAAAAERGLARLRNAGVKNVLGVVLNRTRPSRNTIGAYGEAVSGTGHILPPSRPANDARSA